MILIIDILIVAILVAVAVIDATRYIIPDSLSALIALLALAKAYFAGHDAVLIALSGGLIATVLFEATRRIMSFRLKREAMGFGDVKLMAAGGIWVGAQALAPAIMIACGTALIGFLISGLIDQAGWRNREIPFGPFLALGLVISRGTELYVIYS